VDLYINFRIINLGSISLYSEEIKVNINSSKYNYLSDKESKFIINFNSSI